MLSQVLKRGSVTIFSDFLHFFARVKNGDCSRQPRGHPTMTVWSAAQTTSPPKKSRANVAFRGLALWPPLFSPHKMAAKNHRLSWHSRFKPVTVELSQNVSNRWYASQPTIFFFQIFRSSTYPERFRVCIAWKCHISCRPLTAHRLKLLLLVLDKRNWKVLQGKMCWTVRITSQVKLWQETVPGQIQHCR